MRGTAQTLLTTAITVGLSPDAMAHGGVQESQQIVTAGTPSVVRTNYGILRADTETDWRWTCEEVAGSLEITDYIITGDGHQLISNFDGLYRSTDGCQWDLVDNELMGGFITDLDPNGARLWATTALAGGDNGLWFSEDGGLTFSKDSDFGEESRLRSVAHNGDSMWVSGWTADQAWAAHRDGADSTWTSVNFEPDDDPIRIIRVHQVDERGHGWFLLSRELTSEVWEVAPDGSASVRLRVDADIEAVLVDGDLALAGTRDDSAWQSTDRGETWSEYTDVPDMGCIVVDDNTVHICSHNWRDGAASMAATRSLEPLDEWVWTPTLWYGDVHAMETCSAGTTVADRCGPLWAAVVPAAGYNLDRDSDTGSPSTPEKGCDGCAHGAGTGLWWGLALLGLVRRRNPKQSTAAVVLNFATVLNVEA